MQARNQVNYFGIQNYKFHKYCVFKERENGLNELSRRRERDATQREVDKLRASIQTLTRTANPLGKLMDYLQEDVDSMQVNNIVYVID